jgi:hypothetical protein
MKAVMMPYGSPAAQPMLAPTLVPMKMRNFTGGLRSRKRTPLPQQYGQPGNVLEVAVDGREREA